MGDAPVAGRVPIGVWEPAGGTHASLPQPQRISRLSTLSCPSWPKPFTPNIKISRILNNLTVNLSQRHTFCGIIHLEHRFDSVGRCAPMCSDDCLDSLYLHRGVVHSVDPSDLLLELMCQRLAGFSQAFRALRPFRAFRGPNPSPQTLKFHEFDAIQQINLLTTPTFCGIIE